MRHNVSEQEIEQTLPGFHLQSRVGATVTLLAEMGQNTLSLPHLVQLGTLFKTSNIRVEAEREPNEDGDVIVWVEIRPEHPLIGC